MKHDAEIFCGECNVISPNEKIVAGAEGEMEESGDEDDDGVSKEKVNIKRVTDPMLPSKADIEEHMLSHLPYRNWCEHCVKGRGKQMAHFKSKEIRNTIEFHCDFCFPGGEADEKEGDQIDPRTQPSRK